MSLLVVSWQRLLTVEILQLPRSRHSWLTTVSQLNSAHSQSYVTTDGQSTSLSWCQAPIWGLRFLLCQRVASLSMWGALSDERTGLPFGIASGPRQQSFLSQSPATHYHILLSQIRDSPTREPGPRIYIPQEQGDPVISPGTGFSFRHLLRPAKLRWRYSHSPPRGWPLILQFTVQLSRVWVWVLYYDRRTVGQSVLE
jgi:hypothetical protein